MYFSFLCTICKDAFSIQPIAKSNYILIYRQQKPIDSDILRTMKVVQNVGYAPNLGTRRRNQMNYQSSFSPNKKKGKNVPSSPLGRGKNLSDFDSPSSELSISEGEETSDFNKENILNYLQRIAGMSGLNQSPARPQVSQQQVPSNLDLLLARFQNSFSPPSTTVTSGTVSDTSLTSLDPNFFTSQIPAILRPNNSGSFSPDSSLFSEDHFVQVNQHIANIMPGHRISHSFSNATEGTARPLRGQGFVPAVPTELGRKITRSFSDPWIVETEAGYKGIEAKRLE